MPNLVKICCQIENFSMQKLDYVQFVWKLYAIVVLYRFRQISSFLGEKRDVKILERFLINGGTIGQTDGHGEIIFNRLNYKCFHKLFTLFLEYNIVTSFMPTAQWALSTLFSIIECLVKRYSSTEKKLALSEILWDKLNTMPTIARKPPQCRII